MLPRVSRWLLWLLDEHKGCRSENIGHPPPRSPESALVRLGPEEGFASAVSGTEYNSPGWLAPDAPLGRRFRSLRLSRTTSPSARAGHYRTLDFPTAPRAFSGGRRGENEEAERERNGATKGDACGCLYLFEEFPLSLLSRW